MLFDLLWYARGSVPIGRSASALSVMDHVGDLLGSVGKSVHQEREDYATFDGPPFSVTFFIGGRSQALVPYDRGRFGIAETARGRELRYEFRRLYAFWAAIAFIGFGAAGVALHEGLAAGVRFGAILALAFIGLSKLAEMSLLPHTIGRVVELA